MDDNITLHSLDKLGFPDYAITETGRVYSYLSNTYPVPKVHRDRYLFIRMKNKSGKYINRYIHRLVALMFIENKEGKHQVNHIDGIKSHNWKSNLEWMTNRENVQHAMDSGLWNHWKLTEERCHQVCSLLEQGESTKKISDDLDIPYFTIHAVKMKRNWTHISDQYNIPDLRKRQKCLGIDQVNNVCTLLKQGMSVVDVAKAVNTSADNITKIKSGKHYRYISQSYW